MGECGSHSDAIRRWENGAAIGMCNFFVGCFELRNMSGRRIESKNGTRLENEE